MDDIDFKAKVTRAEFEDLCADLFERVPGPVLDALTAAELKLVSESCRSKLHRFCPTPRLSLCPCQRSSLIG